MPQFEKETTELPPEWNDASDDMSRAIARAVSQLALGEKFQNVAHDLGGIDQLLKRVIHPPWMKPVAEMIRDGVKQRDLGQATLVVDLAGYSRLCQILPPEILMVVMERFHVTMYEISKKYGGQLVREPLGDATVHVFEEPSLAIIAAHEMQARMKTFIDEQMKQTLLRQGYRTEGFVINVGIAQGPVTLELAEMGDGREIVFMCGAAYEKVTKMLSQEKARGVVIDESGIIPVDEELLALGLDVDPPPEKTIGDIQDQVQFAVSLMATTSMDDPSNLVQSPDMSEKYTTIAAFRLEDNHGANVLSNHHHPLHVRAVEMLNDFCWKYSDTEVCKSGDKGELIVMNRDSAELIKMAHEVSLRMGQIGIALQCGIFGGTFHVEALYKELSPYWWDVHSAAFASAVRAANFNKGSGKANIYIEKRLAERTPGIVSESHNLEFHNMGLTALATLKGITDDLGKPQVPLIGRDRELSAARKFFTSDEAVLMFEGIPGIGKNRLLAELADERRNDGNLVVFTDNHGLEAFLADVLAQLSSQSIIFQSGREGVSKEKIAEFASAPHEFSALLAANNLSLKVFITNIHQMPMRTLNFISAMLAGAKSQNLQLVANFTESEHALDSLAAAGFKAALDKRQRLDVLEQAAVRQFIEEKIAVPLTDEEMERLVQEGILIPQVLECFLPSLTLGGEELKAALGSREQGQVVQGAVEKLLAEKNITPEEKRILVDLSLFNEPLELNLLAKFFKFEATALAKILNTLVDKGLVIKHGDTSYSIAESPLLRTLSHSSLLRGAELHKEVGTYFMEMAETLAEDDPEKLATMEKAARYVMSTSVKNDFDYIYLQHMMSEAQDLAQKQHQPAMELHFLSMHRILVARQHAVAILTGSQDIGEFEREFLKLATEEGALANSIGKTAEAKAAFEIIIPILDNAAQPLQKMDILRNYITVLRTMGFDEANLRLIGEVTEKLEQTKTTNEKEDLYKQYLVEINKLTIRVGDIERTKRSEECAAELEKILGRSLAMYQDAREFLPLEHLCAIARIIHSITIQIPDHIQPEIAEKRDKIRAEIGSRIQEKVPSRTELSMFTVLLKITLNLYWKIAKQSKNEEDIVRLEEAAQKFHDFAAGLKDVGALGRALNFLGEARYFKNDLPAAENCYQQALEANSADIHIRLPAIINLSRIYSEMGRYEEAFIEARKAYQLISHHRIAAKFAGFYSGDIEEVYNTAATKLGHPEISL